MLTKLSKITVATLLAVSSSFAPVSQVFAKEKNTGDVTVVYDGNKVTIGNQAIEREFDTTANKLTTTTINNKLGNKEFKPAKEEFIINLLEKDNQIAFQKPSTPLTSVKPSAQAANVSVTVSSTTNEAGVNANNIIDGKANTHWASAESASQEKGSQWVEINLGSEQTIKSVTYTPRWDNTAKYNCTGRVNEYKLETWDGEKYVQAATGTFTVDGNTASGKGTSTIALSQAVTTSKIRLTGLDTYFWDGSLSGKVMNVAELDVLDENNASLIHKQATGAWVMEGTSVATNEGGGYAALIDGQANTYYHSRYNETGNGTTNKLPIDLTLDRGNNTPFNTFGYLPREHNTIANGDILEYEIYVSNDKANLYQAANKQLASKFIYNDAFENGKPQFMYASFDQEQTGRYVGIRVLKGHGGNFAAGAEINLYKEKFDTFDKAALLADNSIKTSDLTLQSVEQSEIKADDKKIKKDGVALTFTFEPFKGAQIVERVVMYHGDHFMRKVLEIKFDDKTQRIDYIDSEHLVLNDSDDYWTIPHAGGVVAMEEFKANLGQPIYVDGLFLGSEFPANQTEVINKVGFTRYYTGKNFEDFKRDNQLQADGTYVSWASVVGASDVADTKGNNLDIVKQSFFNYIDSIATPSEFRIQYNSWFDNMMRITDENILSSFSAVDKHFSATGVRPLDSYVVDDGWNIYRKSPNHLQSALDIERNGKDDVNHDGFWTFNSKFPNKFTPSSNLVHNFGSNFGVWVGPRGGYNYYGDLADIITAGVDIDDVHHQYGSKAGGSIDVADQRYVTKFQEMALNWQRDYGVNYWKWDGFADDAQFNSFPSGDGVVGYDENHHHMYGGPHHMYHVTDLWEKWIKLFEQARESEKVNGIDNLWISLTCYTNPSPWFLQWANSVWLQCVGDRGERWNETLNNKMDNMLTYRDACYYDFVVQHQFQFPLANVYNHDPIYGTEGTGINKNSMDAEQFENYMFMQGTRGTAFWELHYSDSIFDEEKYLINADFLEWAEGNFDLLRNGIMIGNNPSTTSGLSSGPIYADPGTQDAYGFSGFNKAGTEGIISMRNPAATEKTISFVLDAAIGVKTAKGTNYFVTKGHSYITKGQTSKAVLPTEAKQGDTITVTLQSGETYILHFSTEKDVTAPVVNKLYIKDADTVQVKTSEAVLNGAFTVEVDGHKVEATIEKAFADDRTFDLALAAPLTKGARVVVKASAGTDDANNVLAGQATLKFYPNGEIVAAKKVKENNVISTADNSVEGNNGFAVTTNVKTTDRNVVLVSQGNDYELGIDQDGKPYFELNGIRATSDKVANTGSMVSIAGVKENNGIIKVYVNGHVRKSAYKLENKEFAVTAADIHATNVEEVKVYNRSLGFDEVPVLPAEVELRGTIAQVEAEKTSFTSASWEASNLETLLANAKEALKAKEDATYQTHVDALNNAYKTLVPETASSNLALGKPVSSGWVDNAYDGDGTDSGRPLAIAVDGAKNSRDSYSIFGHVTSGQTTKPSYMQVDLGTNAAIDKVQLYRYFDNRTYNSTAVVVSNTADFKEYKVLYYSGNEDIYGLNVQPDQALYQETAEGKTLFNDASKPVVGRYLRVYGNGVQGNNTSENHIVELEVYGKVADPYNVKALETLIEEATVLAQDSKYSEASLEALNTQIANANEVVAAVKVGTQEDKTIGYVLNAKEALETAIANLEVKKADVTLSNLSLSLADYIGVNYYFDFSETVLNDANAYVEFTREDQSTVKYMVSEIKENTKVVNGKTLYRASVPMAARQMSEAIKGKVVYGENNVVELENMSVQGYADVIYKNEGNKYSAEAVAAVKAMLNYGTAAQMNFKNKIKQPANAILSADDQKVVVDDSVFAQYKSNKEGSVTGLDYFGTSVLLKSKTGFAHYFTLTDGSIEDYTFTIGGKEVQPQMKNGKYFVEFSDIYAKNLADSYELVVTKDNESMSIAFSVFAYANIVVKGDYSDELKAVVRSMYPYYEAALAYSKTVK